MKETLTMEHYDIDEAIEAQEAYTEDKRLPMFAPGDGVCWHCWRNIYEKGGFSVEDAGSKIITGCPFCGITFAD